jgi:hypothetical protein
VFNFSLFDFDNPDFIIFRFVQSFVFIFLYQQIRQRWRRRVVSGNDNRSRVCRHQAID